MPSMLCRRVPVAILLGVVASVSARADVVPLAFDRQTAAFVNLFDGTDFLTDFDQHQSTEGGLFGPPAQKFLSLPDGSGNAQASQHSELTGNMLLLAGNSFGDATADPANPEMFAEAFGLSAFRMDFTVTETTVLQIGGGLSQGGNGGVTLILVGPDGTMLHAAPAGADQSLTVNETFVLEPYETYIMTLTSSGWGQAFEGTDTIATGDFYVAGTFETVVAVPAHQPGTTPITLGPNPVRAGGTISLGLASDEPVSVRVLDVTGRLVNRFETSTPGGVVHWDVRDSRGNALAPGVYFVRVAGSHVAETARLTVVD